MNFGNKWHAIGREGSIAAEQLAQGITALGKANHAQPGFYGQAFFGLSIGLERLAKLIIISEFAIKNNGRFPKNNYLKNFGHDLKNLLQKCNSISIEYRSGEEFSEMPSSDVHKGILLTLTEFAKLTRYYNLELITENSSTNDLEPVSAWWNRVGKGILAMHYSERQRKRDESEASFTNLFLQDHVSVIHHDENQNPLDSVEKLMMRGAATRIVQKYRRLYTMQIIRWLSYLIAHLSHTGGYEHRIEALFRLDEYFVIFRNSDQYLRDRKTWSIYRP